VNARRILSIVMLLAAAVPLGAALAQAPLTPAAKAPAAAPKPAIATVGTRRVNKDEFDQRSVLAISEFAQRNGGKELPAEFRDLIRRQVLEGMIRIQLLIQEAARTGVTVDPLVAEEQMKKDPFFNPNGTFDPNRFLSVKTTQPAAFTAARENIRAQLAARKLNEQLETKLRPADADLRATATRQLSLASLEHLSLRRADFTGAAPEPRELAIVQYYKSHGSDYHRLDRATITVAFVNTPGLTDSARAIPATLSAWNSRMHAIADSVIKVVANGTPFDQAAAFLGPRPGIIVTSDNFPGYWQGNAAQSASVFRTKPGEILTEAIPGADGFLIVRVDDVKPAHTAELREVAREIRNILRRDSRAHHVENEERALYATLRDSLSAPGAKIRYASTDTARVPVGEPSADDLDRYYRGHLADYSAFDTKVGGIVSRPFADVKDEIRRRWLHDQRTLQARLLADQLLRVWSTGKRDAALESSLQMREPAAAPKGADLDTGVVARALSDTIWSKGIPTGTGMVPYSRGWIVWQAVASASKVTPTFEQSRTALGVALDGQKRRETEEGARKLFDADPKKFGLGDVIHFTRIAIKPMDILDVKLTRAQVAKYREEHIEQFSSPEEVRARHILISPADNSPAADKAAREKAAAIIAQLKAGEDFGKLCKANSDDPATKDKGGDLGVFGRGTMLDAFEKAAFAMQPGDLSPAPVKTEVGYHIIRCEEHLPAITQPLDLVYTNVASACAQAFADTIAHLRADSLARVLRDPAQGRAAAAKLGIPLEVFTHNKGEQVRITNVVPYFEALEKLKPGEVMRQPYRMKGQGTWVTWVDSLSPPSKPTWEDASNRAVEEYMRGAGQRALDAKKAELDSLFAAGWSFDSLGALWNGPEVAKGVTPARGITGLGGSAVIDSMVFGGKNAPVLAVGQVSGWLDLPNSYTRIRIAERIAPQPQQIETRVQNVRAATVERGLRDYFAGLEKRYPVKILDAKLRETAVPGPPPGDTP
jgi:parvulin-like peptidyl-prolyl isomerase